MIDFDLNEYCSGCGACASVCPAGAVTMISNAEGFAVPLVDKDKCTGCGLCEKVCVHLSGKPEGTVRGSWMFSSGDSAAKEKSSSGAAWFELGRTALNEGRYICGCAWDDGLTARHIVGNTMGTLVSTQGSKYVQSDMDGILRIVLDLLKSGNKVLFSGTPCQSTALHDLIMNSAAAYRDNILITAVICHGVASPLAWRSYKAWEEARHGSVLKAVNFRDKSREGYKKCYCKYGFSSGETTYLPTYLPSSPWMESAIIYNLSMRNSCAHCDCKGTNGAIDLILGDWYSEHKGEGAMGTSCIAAFTERGALFAEKALEGLRPLGYDAILEKNGMIEYSSPKSPRRGDFFKALGEDSGIWDNVEKFYPPKYKLKRILVRTGTYDILKKIIG